MGGSARPQGALGALWGVTHAGWHRDSVAPLHEAHRLDVQALGLDVDALGRDDRERGVHLDARRKPLHGGYAEPQTLMEP